MKRILIFAALALLVAQGAVFGQAQKGSVTVSVTDANGDPLPGATVEASSDQTLSRRTAITDAEGTASLFALDPATNYVVTTTMDGFNGARNTEVRVRAGSNTTIRVTLNLSTVVEEVIVTAESPLVDVTSAATGQDITLALVESLPTARTYQSYLQLVPGVQATVVDDFGNDNPASRSGMNYSDIGGAVGSSSDNFYYFEGINVTDSVSGVAGAFLNTEIIQEQSVLTGGLAAEFVGATGLVSNVITKSGGNSLSGSVNYYFQDDNLVASNDNRADETFSTYDTAFTLGGPIVQDKAWFYGSYRLVNREQTVVDVDNNPLRAVTRDDKQGFAKLSWSPVQSGILTGIYLSDPFELDGTFNDQASNLRDSSTERGGDRITGTYAHVWNSLVLDIGYADHDRDLNTIPVNLDTRSDINFRNEDGDQPLTALQKGGSGTTGLETRGAQVTRGSLEYLADTSWGSHTLKLGAELSEMNDFRNFVTEGDGGIYNSLSTLYLGQNTTASDISAGTFQVTDFNSGNTSDVNGFNDFASPAVFALLDANHDGVISTTEAGAIVFNSTSGNPYGDINYDRIFQTTDGEQFTKSEGTSLYLQDTWQNGKWSVNLGLRTEEWEHFGTDGSTVYTFPNEVAPRLSVVYDLKGDGRQRLSAYYGRYYDPIRNNMTNFAGSLTGRERREQVFVTTNPATGAGEWTTYRIRGGPAQPDAFFAPSTQTPFTDEYQLGYKVDLGQNMSFEANVVSRHTDDILEDYDLQLYANPSAYGLPVDHPDSLFLGLGYFGYSDFPVDANGNAANFIIGTIAGGQRDWDGLELIFRKRMSNHWQMLASYNFADATGNTNSDSNADFQGDVLWLDPRAINQEGTQPGLVEHLLKVAGTYQWDSGFSVGGAYRWNSGAIVSRTFSASRRNLPVWDINDPEYTGELIQFAGGDGFGAPGERGFWISPGAVGQFENPSYGTLDLRASYLWTISGRFQADFFLDVFNALDDQATIRTQDLVGGGSGVNFNEGLDFVDPRRFYLGARLRF